jgi:hypothetical protein
MTILGNEAPIDNALASRRDADKYNELIMSRMAKRSFDESLIRADIKTFSVQAASAGH